MTAASQTAARLGSAQSADGTPIGYRSLGAGPGLIVLGGVLSTRENYVSLAEQLASRFTVHLVDRRGRPASGPQREGHAIADEIDDLSAVMEATGASQVFGHSFGGLVALEAARHSAALERVFVYEPGVPRAGGFDLRWLDGFERYLEHDDPRGAFAWMVKHAGFAPRPLQLMPMWCVRAAMRVAIRSRRWAAMEPLVDASLGEHRIQAALEHSPFDRFAAIGAPTTLLGGAASPDALSRELLNGLARVIPDATVEILAGVGHLAPEQQSQTVAAAILRHS